MNQQLNFPVFGKLSPRILEQDKVWRTADGSVLPLESLETDHLQRIPHFLLIRGNRLRMRWAWMMVTLGGDVSGADGLIDQLVDEEEKRPLASWLEERPLLQRIGQILAERGAEPYC